MVPPKTPQASTTTTQNTSSARPVLITVLCIIGFIGAAVGTIAALLLIGHEILGGQTLPGEALPPPIWLTIYSLISTLLFLAFLLYIWKMKKWALIAYTILVVFNTIIDIITGYGSIITIGYSVVFIMLFYLYYNRMT